MLITSIRSGGRQQKREDRIKQASQVKVEIYAENYLLEGTVVHLKHCWLKQQIMDFWLQNQGGGKEKPGLNQSEVDESMLFLKIFYSQLWLGRKFKVLKPTELIIT